MSEQNLEQNVRQNVLERIERGNVSMRSKAYFIGRAVAALVVAGIVLLLSVFVLSFIVFAVHESGEQFLLGYGAVGIQTFLVLFPWAGLLTDVALVFLLQALLQGFKFGYRVPLLVLFVVAFVLSAALAMLVNLTPLHQFLMDRADQGDLPVLGAMYENLRAPHEENGIFRGTIANENGNQITIVHNDGDHDADDGTRTVVMPPGMKPPPQGARVYVFGTSTGQMVHAYGVDQLDPDQ